MTSICTYVTMQLKYFSFVFILLLKHHECARILGAVFTPSYSHQVAFQPIWRELSLRGHQLTVLTTNPMNDSSLKNLTEIDLSMSYEIMKSHKANDLLSATNESVVVRVKGYMNALHAVADAQFAHPEVQNLIHNSTEPFDLLMVEAIYPTQMALAWWFKVPFIGMISLDAPSRIHAAVGNPIHPVLYPDYDLPFDKNLTFWERLISVIFSLFMMWYTEYRLHPREDMTIKKYLGNDAPSIGDIQKNMSMLFINVNPIFHNIRPLVPATIRIGGGIHLQKPKPLPSDIQTYLDNAKNGFVYFSLGTNVKSASLLPEVRNSILKALSALPYQVLWKFENEHVPDKPSNVKIVQWVPQTSVLAHSNIKAFITQCGLQSMEEAIVYRVPMIGIPFYGDQGNNAKHLVSKGLGVKLSSTTLTKDDLYDAVIEVTSNPIYKENLEEIATLYNDEEMSALEKAVWWTEYVIRHKGAKHLRSSAIDVPLYQYFCLDIIAFFLGVIITLLHCLKVIISLILRIIFGKKKTKSKKE